VACRRVATIHWPTHGHTALDTSYFRLFGIGTWLNLNGIWIELPLLIPRLPEGWSLSPHLGLASNLANIGPLIIALIRCATNQSSAYEVPSICVIFTVGIVVPVVLSFTWFEQVLIFGQSRSIYLLVLAFCLALVNCTSSVTYLPFVNRFDTKWLNIYFAGESLSSLIPAMLGLAQVGRTRRVLVERRSCVSLAGRRTKARVCARVVELDETDRQAFPGAILHPGLFDLSVRADVDLVLGVHRALASTTTRQEAARRRIAAGQRRRRQSVAQGRHRRRPTQHSEGHRRQRQRPVLDGIDHLSRDHLLDEYSAHRLCLIAQLVLVESVRSNDVPSCSHSMYAIRSTRRGPSLCLRLSSGQCCYPLVSFISMLHERFFRVSNTGIAVSTLTGTIAFVYIFMTGQCTATVLMSGRQLFVSLSFDQPTCRRVRRSSTIGSASISW
jgi:hypothetical protein